MCIIASQLSWADIDWIDNYMEKVNLAQLRCIGTGAPNSKET